MTSAEPKRVLFLEKKNKSTEQLLAGSMCTVSNVAGDTLQQQKRVNNAPLHHCGNDICSSDCSAEREEGRNSKVERSTGVCLCREKSAIVIILLLFLTSLRTILRNYQHRSHTAYVCRKGIHLRREKQVAQTDTFVSRGTFSACTGSVDAYRHRDK